MADRSEPPTKPNGGPFVAHLDDAVRTLGQAVRREIRSTILGVVVSLTSILLLVITAMTFVISGAVRLGDALARLAGHWFGDQALGDAVIGFACLMLPLSCLLLLRLRS